MADEFQQKAIDSVNGNHFVLSPAGSGKTYTAILRIKNLIQNGIPDKKILFVTFSKKASIEMKERLDSVMLGNKVFISTLHSLSFSLLKKITGNSYHVVDDYGKTKIFREIFKENKYPEDMMYRCITVIDKIQQEHIEKSSIDFPFYCNGSQSLSQLTEDVYDDYYNKKSAMYPEGLDFNDMLNRLLLIAKDNDELKNRLAQIWEHIIVDEFQDTSYVQFEIIKILAKGNNLFVIGDHNQCIYEWRSANPNYMKNFDYYCQDANKIHLKYTYRCDDEIINFANTLVEEQAVSATGKKGFVSKIKTFPEEFSEAEWVAKEIADRPDDTVKILYRTNAYSLQYEMILPEYGIPFKVIGQQQFFNRKEFKDIVSFVDVITNKPKKLTDSWTRIINKPNRYLGKAFVQQLQSICNSGVSVIQALKSQSYSHKYMNDNALRLAILIENAPTKNLLEIIDFVLDKIGYRSFILHDNDETEIDSSSSEEVLNEVIVLAKRTNDIVKFVNLQSKADDNAKVELMTIHKSKGLEADTVFVVGLCDDILPHRLNGNIDEEKRLLYVASTRAKRNLFLSAPMNYNGKRRSLSRFIGEAVKGE